MIVVDTSVQPIFTKQAEAIAVMKELVAHFEQRWPLSVPRQVLVDMTGELGRIHIVTVRESLAEHERQLAEQQTDTTVQAAVQRLEPLTVAGSGRVTFQRVV